MSSGMKTNVKRAIIALIFILVLAVFIHFIYKVTPRPIKIPLVRCIDSQRNVIYVKVSIGTPPQDLRFLFEFGLKGIAVGELSCNLMDPKLRVCLGDYSQYRGFASETRRRSSRLENVVEDTVSISGHYIGMQYLLLKTDKSFYNLSLGGLAGLGSFSDSDAPIAALIRENFIKEKIVSVYVTANRSSSDAGEVLIGDKNPLRYRGEFKYVNATLDDDGLWNFEVNSIKVADEIITQGNISVTIYTTIPQMEFPEWAFQVANTIIKAKPIKHAIFDHEVDCATIPSLPNITISITSADFIISPDDYVIEVEEFHDGGQRCFLTVEVSQTSTWGLGESFTRRYYSVFHLQNNTIGFAESVH